MEDSPKRKSSKKKGSRESGLPPKNEVCSTSFRVRQFTKSWMTKSSKSITDDDDIWKLKPEDIHIDRLLGQGSFSTARLVYVRNPTTGHFESDDETFVMKRLKASVLEDELSFQMAASDIGIETRILASLRHANILRLRGVKAGNMMDGLRDGNFFLVVDWLVETLDVRLARWGTRKSLLFRAQENATVLRRLQDIALGIAEGMEYLHSKQILFRDLKPANIGFDQLGTVKIFDFGLSREYLVDEHGNPIAQCRQMTGGAGTPRYMAPEVARMETNYGFGVDVYSFGILLWQIVTNKVPFSKIKSPPEFFQKVVAGNKRPKLKRISSSTLQQLIESCWSANPYLRPSFSLITKILRHMIDNRPSIRQSSHASTRKSRRSSMIAIASNIILAASTKSNIKKKRARRHLSLPPSLSGMQQSGPLESHSTTSAVSASSAPDSDTSRSGSRRSHRRIKRTVSLKLAASSASLTQRSASTYRSSSLSQRSLFSMVSPVVRRSKRDSLTERFMSWSRITPMPWANSTS